MLEKTDENIARQVQSGEAEAFGLLVERYEPKLHRYAKRFLFGYEDAQDLLQEIFLKAFSNIRSFDATRNFSSWIYRVAHNEFINFIKKKGREPLPFFDPDTLFPHPVAPGQADDEIKDSELKEMMEKCLNGLAPKYREPLVLYYFEDLDYQRISDILRLPVSTVGVRINRGKKLLKNIYFKQYPKL